MTYYKREREREEGRKERVYCESNLASKLSPSLSPAKWQLAFDGGDAAVLKIEHHKLPQEGHTPMSTIAYYI